MDKHRHTLAVLFYLFPFYCAAAPLPLRDSSAQELLRQQDRDRAQREQLEKQTPDVRLLPDVEQPETRLTDETPCFPVDRVLLEGPSADKFQWALRAVSVAGDFIPGRCLGGKSINLVMRRVQNAIIARGYITTRILAKPQDLTRGELLLTVVPGRVRAIRYAGGSDGQRITLRNALPASPGDILNLRDIEQGLENLRRVPTADADIQIAPGDNAGESDLVIVRKQTLPLRVAFSLDDAGSISTGRYQGSVALSVDNPLRLNDLLYVSAGHSLGGNSNPGDDRKGTQNYSAWYSAPWGYWQLSVAASQYDYHQTVPGYLTTYQYSGKSQNADVRLSRILYRDGSRKTTASVRGWT